jgi:hypothetical protein
MALIILIKNQTLLMLDGLENWNKLIETIATDESAKDFYSDGSQVIVRNTILELFLICGLFKNIKCNSN